MHSQAFHHVTVLEEELVAALALNPGDTVIDCTAGGGGHSRRLLEAIGPKGKLLAIDRDPQAIAVLNERFATEVAQGQVLVQAAPFSQVGAIVAKLQLSGQVAGIAADLGVSSPQLDQASRGFSLQQDGPLDMRMDPIGTTRTAAQILAEYSAEQLARIFFQFGEEPQARRIAQAIVTARARQALTRTQELAELVSRALPYAKKSRKHPATKVFQALRIYINAELSEISTMLEAAFSSLKPQGRLAVISFHSLEDRLVKRFCQAKAGKLAEQRPPRGLPLTAAELATYSQASIIKPFPRLPTAQECQENPRARSAKLRSLMKT